MPGWIRWVGLVAAAALPIVMMGPVTPSHAAGTATRAEVVRVVDGDTVRVDLDGDRRWDQTVRLTGIDTPERGTCGYSAAKSALRRLLRHKTVRLRSDTGSTGRRQRVVRRVVVRLAGRDVDATTWLLERGLGVWMPRKGEFTKALAHHRAAETAATGQIGWFDDDRCGSGPAPSGSLSLQVQYLADAAHKLTPAERRNEEFIRIRNDGAETVDLDGWTLRVGNDRRTKIPAGGPIPPGETLTVHVGSGTGSLLHRYLGSSVPMLTNAELDSRRHVGSGSYLVDTDGDIQAHATWPCVVGCRDPFGGALVISEVTVDPPGPDYLSLNGEAVVVRNVSDVTVRTGDVVLEVAPWVYEFPADHVLHPGQAMTLRGGAGQDTLLDRYLHARNPPLRNDGGRVVLRTYDAIVLDCFRWGTGRCPRLP